MAWLSLTQPRPELRPQLGGSCLFPMLPSHASPQPVSRNKQLIGFPSFKVRHSSAPHPSGPALPEGEEGEKQAHSSLSLERTHGAGFYAFSPLLCALGQPTGHRSQFLPALWVTPPCEAVPRWGAMAMAELALRDRRGWVSCHPSCTQSSASSLPEEAVLGPAELPPSLQRPGGPASASETTGKMGIKVSKRPSEPSL